MSRARRIWVWVILGLATLLTILAIFSIWADRQLLNPTNWSNTSTALLQKPRVRAAIATYLVDQLYANVDVPGQLESGLPKELKPLSGPVSGALHNLAEEGAEKALESPRLQDVWRRANHAADETLVRIVDGGGSRVQIEGGTVSLNLRQIVAELAHRLGLPDSVAEKLPASVANLKVLTSEDLGLVRNVAKAVHALAVWLIVIVVALFALAIYLAPGARRRTLARCGWSLVLSGVVVLIGRKIGQGQLVGAITNDASIQPAANDSYEVATSLLVLVAGASIIIGIPVIASAWFAGPARWAVAGRRFLAPYFAARPPLAYLLTAALLAILFLWGPIPATGNPVTMLLFTVLSFIGAHLLRRQILEEFPDAQPISIRESLTERAHALGERVERLRGSRGANAGGGDSKVAELERLAALHDRRALSDAEYAEAKQAVLAG